MDISQITSSEQSAFVFALQVLTLLGSLYMFRKKYQLAEIDKSAEAAVDKANATATNLTSSQMSLTLHMKAVEALIERDMQIVELSRRLALAEARMAEMEAGYNSRISALEKELAETTTKLNLERTLREALQSQLDSERNIRTLNNLAKSHPVLLPQDL